MLVSLPEQMAVVVLQIHVIEQPRVYPNITGARTNARYTRLLPGYEQVYLRQQ